LFLLGLISMPISHQFNIYAKNSPGTLAKVSKTLSNGVVNILAATVVDNTDTGIIRVVVDDEKAGRKALNKSGFSFSENRVLLLEMPHRRGAMAEVTERLSQERINVSYVYGSAAGPKALMVLRVSNLKAASKLLE